MMASLRTPNFRKALFTPIALLSLLGLLAAVCASFRMRRTSDAWEQSIWNPQTRTFIERRLVMHGDFILVHLESTTALPGDNIAALLAMVGPTNLRLIHRTSPSTAQRNDPWLWTDHYRCTPSLPINTSGLSDCRTLEFRIETMLIFFGILPALWMITTLRQWNTNRTLHAIGFPVVQSNRP